jgi:hypothetical protein
MRGCGGWRERWRVTRKLHSGRSIPVEERETTRTVIVSFRKHPELGWLYGISGLVWLYVATLAHGDGRFACVGAGVLSVATGLHWTRSRKRIVGREPEIAPLDSP